ncbi:MAG: Ppx/GppA family phosphatase [Chloroflexi bacterium]|nr:Ppx/GppA family phosphatase [Chloroflexota bacterium]
MNYGRVVAVIDVGSNSVRLLVARELSPVAFEVIDEERFDARIGEGQADGDLTPEGIARGLHAMRVVSQVAASYGATVTVVAGTEALRRAPNAASFIEAARAETGLTVRVLSAAEEAFASFLGAINSTGLRDGHVVDVGGGSLEVMRVEGRALVRSQSAPLGAIYASERYLRNDPPTAKDVRALRKAVRQQIEIHDRLPALYGVGGALRNLARIVRLRRRYPLRRLHGLAIERREMRRLASDLASAPAEARRKVNGLNSSRADIIPAAAIVLDEIMEMTGAPALNVSGQGLREGLVWQELRGEGAILPDVRTASISGLARANGVDALAAEPVVIVAAQLFEATRQWHSFGAPEEDLLLSAARLAGIGMHVDYYNRDRHAEYLVHSGDLHGFSHREIVLLGAIVRSATAGTPDLTANRAILEQDDGHRVAVLAALLGAAEAIRRRRPSPVHSVELSSHRGGLHIELRGGDSLDAEIAALERQQKRLESALKIPVSVSVRA